ncbi:hypothetical protein, partial [Erythrobacter sp.]|uniref:hypothetical protein n=1 Tax=Erythrobacter sp. TaxID=1042 RepID=UPI00311E30F7
MANDGDELLAPRASDRRSGENIFGVFQGRNGERSRKDTDPVLLARQKLAFFKPGYRRFDPRIVGELVPLEIVILLGADDLAGRRDHIAMFGGLIIEAAQGLEDGANFMPRKTGAGRERELPLHIVVSKQQHAIGMLTVTPGAPRFLQIVLERSRDIAMHDE